MAEKAVPNTWRVAIVQSLSAGADMVNVLHVNHPNDVSLGVANANALVDAIEQAYVVSGIAADLHNQWQIQEFRITDIGLHPFIQQVIPSDIAGENAGSPLPNQVALTVTWRTAFIGRNYRGRTYLGGFVEAASSGNSPENAVLNRVNTWATTLRQAIEGIGAGWDLSIVSRYLNKVERDVPVANPVTSHSLGGIWDTQRRRKVNEVV